MTIKTLTIAVIALLLAPVAAAQTQAEQIVGRWTCLANTPDGMISSQMNYGSDGVVRAVLVMAIGDSEGQVIADITAAWRAPGDGTLREKLTKLDVVRFTMGGQVVNGDALKASLMEAMKDEVQSGSLQLTATSLTMIDVDGVRTSCVR